MTKRFFQRQHTWFDVFVIWVFVALFCAALHADTPAPGIVKAKVQDGVGNPIGSTSGSLNVNVTNSGGSSTVNQGNAGSQAWLFDLSKLFGAAPSATNYMPARISNGTTYVDPTQIRALNSGTDSVTISGSVTATNSANGAPGSPVPAQATQVAGSDGVNLRVLKASSSGVLSVDGSASTQPVSGSVAVTNLPGVQPVSQSGTWTVQQGTPPWSINLTQLSGATPGATNSLASRITNGTTFVDPTQIRALTSGTDSVNIGNFPATQPVSGTVTANAGTGTFTVGQATGTNLHTVVDNFPATQTVTGTVAATQSGTWNINNISGTVSLPTGAATSALQTSGNSSLSSIDTKTPALGQALAAASVPVVLTAAQLSTLTPLSTVAVTQSTSPWVVSGTVTANAGTNLNTSALALESGGHLASIDTKLTSPLSVAQSGTWNITNISGTVSLPTGAATSANQTNGSEKTQVVDGAGAVVGPVQTISGTNYQPVVLASSATPGSAIVSRSIQIAGSDGTNARTLSTDTTGKLNVLLPVGQTTMSASTPVAIASDQSLSTASQRTASTSFTAAAQTLSIATSGAQSVEVQVSGTYSATIQFEASNDNTTWNQVFGIDYATQSATANTTGTNRIIHFPAVGTNFRARVSAYTSGTAVVTLTANLSVPGLIYAAQGGSWNIQGTQPEGNSISGVFPLITGGIYTSTAPTLSTGTASYLHMDKNGRLSVQANGQVSVQLVRNDYSSTNVTTAAYVQLIASTSDEINQLFIFDSSGQTLFLAVGAAASEVNKAYIVPGGNGILNLNIPSGSRVSVKAVSANATAGELSITFLK